MRAAVPLLARTPAPRSRIRRNSVSTIAVSPDGQVYALGAVVKSGDVQLRTIAAPTKTVTNTLHLSQPHKGMTQLRIGGDGYFYFTDISVVTGSTNNTDGAGRLSLWSIRPKDGAESIIDSACHRVDFSLNYRSLINTNDSHQVAHTNAADGGDINLMPGGRTFVWVVDGAVFSQSI